MLINRLSFFNYVLSIERGYKYFTRYSYFYFINSKARKGYGYGLDWIWIEIRRIVEP
ncbi:hypothetical protein CAEBREN_28962 [Caenorhabditis brenneri]|uniref:Uncharacterized protein n=1 Tax=Caenorhabditis brenneri TaxID=135651 RepID=G0PDP0_CAEBE|nr:hypothetical protein CAEBREN_28962 [Caenorhabditis brenneri]